MTPGAFETREADWLTRAEALERVLGLAELRPAQRVPLDQALGRALRAPALAPRALPPWDNAGMDGYAVRAADIRGASPETPVALRVVGEVRAGASTAEPPHVEPGTAVRIMTGAPVPPGADSVVRVEHTRPREAGVEVLHDRDALGNVRPAGEDIGAGEEALAPGTEIGPGQVAVLASLGEAHPLVGPRPRVGVLASGDELVPVQALLAAGNPDTRGHPNGNPNGNPHAAVIANSNGPTLVAQATAAGAEAVDLGIARDDEGDLLRILGGLPPLDALVTIGGASMGVGDLFKRVLDQLGYQSVFWRARIRPGSPVGFGTLPSPGSPLPVFGLPGNPASSFVTFELFVRPFLRRLAGFARLERPRVPAVAAERMSGPADLEVYLRVTLEADPGPGTLRARLTGPQGSGLVTGLGRADALVVLPEGCGTVEAGDPVTAVVLGEWG